jgi:hypothetical protein
MGAYRCFNSFVTLDRKIELNIELNEVEDMAGAIAYLLMVGGASGAAIALYFVLRKTNLI